MTWGIETYLKLREDGFIRPSERGAMPLPEDVAAAMEARAAAVEKLALAQGAVVDRWMLKEPDEMRVLANEVRAGSAIGREAFRQEMLTLIDVKRGHCPAAGITAYLPADVLMPFGAEHRQPCGEHTRRLAEIAETKELIDPSLRR